MANTVDSQKIAEYLGDSPRKPSAIQMIIRRTLEAVRFKDKRRQEGQPDLRGEYDPDFWEGLRRHLEETPLAVSGKAPKGKDLVSAHLDNLAQAHDYIWKQLLDPVKGKAIDKTYMQQLYSLIRHLVPDDNKGTHTQDREALSNMLAALDIAPLTRPEALKQSGALATAAAAQRNERAK